MSDVTLPYGLRDIKITPFLDQAGTILASTSIDLPYARTFSFTESEDFAELRGDDKLVAEHGSGPTVAFEFESGGFPFEAYKAMAGGTLTETGTEGNMKKVFSKKTTDQRPYFRVEGQALSDSGGDMHGVVYKCKCTGDLTGEWSDGNFFLTGAKGVGFGDINDNLYDFVGNDTVTAFVEPNPSSDPIIDGIEPDGQGTGDSILITGSNLTGLTGITINDIALTGVTVYDDSHAGGVLPEDDAATVDVVATNATGDSAPFSYTRTA